MSDSNKSKTTYSIQELQQMLCVGSVAAYRLVKQNQFKSVKTGRSIRILKNSFDAWLDGVNSGPFNLHSFNVTQPQKINQKETLHV